MTYYYKANFELDGWQYTLLLARDVTSAASKRMGTPSSSSKINSCYMHAIWTCQPNKPKEAPISAPFQPCILTPTTPFSPLASLFITGAIISQPLYLLSPSSFLFLFSLSFIFVFKIQPSLPEIIMILPSSSLPSSLYSSQGSKPVRNRTHLFINSSEIILSSE